MIRERELNEYLEDEGSMRESFNIFGALSLYTQALNRVQKNGFMFAC
jgi:hypothetical protein